MNPKESFSYIGIDELGKCVAVILDNREHLKDVAKSVSELILDGLTVQRVTSKEAVKLFTT